MEKRWLAVVAVWLVLAAGAKAAPPNQINDTHKSNEIVSKDIHVKPDDSKDVKSTLATASKDTDTKVVDTVQVTVKPVVKPVSASTLTTASKDTNTKVVETAQVTVKPVAKPAGASEPKEDGGTTVAVTNGTVAKAVNELNPHAVLFGGTCGGSIISPKWIITAGHCTIFSSGTYVLAGTNRSDDGSGVERVVQRLVLHPKFSVGPYWVNANQFNIRQVAADWDFMLVELADPLPLDGTTMAAVELNDVAEVPVGLPVGYAGYGAEHHGDFMRSEMHGMELEVQADSVCSEALEQYEAETMMCTKGRAPRYDSACNGDSGSGLVADGKLYGVASWVQDDAHRCFNGALVVFSRVSAVRDWIRQVTKI